MASDGWARMRGAGLLSLCCALAGCATSPPDPAQVTTCVPAAVAVGKIYTFEADFFSEESRAPKSVEHRLQGGLEVLGEFVVTNTTAIEADGHVGVQEWRESLLTDYRLAPLASRTLPLSKEHFVVMKVRVTDEGELGDLSLSTVGSKEVLHGNFSLTVREKC